MYNSQLVLLMKALTPREINILYHFINTNCPNKRIIYQETNTTISTNKVNILYDILRKAYPEFTAAGLSKEELYSKMYPDEEYNDKKMRNIIHELSKTIEFYLIHLDSIQEQDQFKMHLINQLEKRNLHKLYDIKLNSLDDLIDGEENRDESYYYHKFQLAERKRVFYENTSALGKNEIAHELLSAEIENFTNYFLTVVYRQLNLANYFKSFLSVDIKTDLYNHIADYLKKEKGILRSNASLDIWNKFLELYKKKVSGGDVSELKRLLDENQKLFSKLDYQYLYTDLLNYCFKLYSGDESLYKEMLIELFNDILKKEVYIRNGIIHYQNYTSLVQWALELGDLSLAEDFINSFRNYLLPEFRDSAYSYNYACYYYKVKDYDKSLEMLRTVKSPDSYFRAGINDLMLKIFYEKNDFDHALNLIDSYKHFLANNKTLPPEYKLSREKFLKYYKELVKLGLGSSRSSPGLLLEKLEKESEIFSKDWLIAAMEEHEAGITIK